MDYKKLSRIADSKISDKSEVLNDFKSKLEDFCSKVETLPQVKSVIIENESEWYHPFNDTLLVAIIKLKREKGTFTEKAHEIFNLSEEYSEWLDLSPRGKNYALYVFPSYEISSSLKEELAKRGYDVIKREPNTSLASFYGSAQ